MELCVWLWSGVASDRIIPSDIRLTARKFHSIVACCDTGLHRKFRVQQSDVQETLVPEDSSGT